MGLKTERLELQSHQRAFLYAAGLVTVFLLTSNSCLAQSESTAPFYIESQVSRGPLIPIVASGAAFDFANYQDASKSQSQEEPGSIAMEDDLQPAGELLTADGAPPAITESMLSDSPQNFSIESGSSGTLIELPREATLESDYLVEGPYETENSLVQQTTNMPPSSNEPVIGSTIGESYFDPAQVQPAPLQRRGLLSKIFGRGSIDRSVSVYGGWTYPITPNYGYYYRPLNRNENGGAFVLNFGRRVSPRLRTAIEFGYQRSDFGETHFYAYDALTISPYEPTTGETRAYTGMFNLYFDFDRMPNRFVTPYVGTGIGMAFLDGEYDPYYGEARSASDSAFAFQAIAGVAVRLKSRLDYMLEYRYFNTSQEDYCEELYGYARDNCQLERSNFFMGLRYRY